MSTLCEDCGLCCDGTLFSSVSIDPTSLEVVERRRLPVLQTAAGPKLSLPCAALRGTLCDVYLDRPDDCAVFTCELLGQVEAGHSSRPRAQAIIEETRAMRDRVSKRVSARWWEAHAGADVDLAADLKRLRYLASRHFWGEQR